jgi:hypothetical protein
MNVGSLNYCTGLYGWLLVEARGVEDMWLKSELGCKETSL